MTSRIDFTQPLHAGAPRLRHAFGTPREVLVASTLAQVRGVIDAVHAGAQRGHWCVGYVRYEAAAAFDTAVQTHAADGPLAWFAVYDAPLAWPGGVANHGDTDTGGAQVAWDDSLPRADFDAALACIQKAIRAGELYQVNYTAALHGTLHGSADALFAALQRAQPGGYGAHINAGAEQVLSDGGREESPSFAPNGRWVMYATQAGGRDSLVAVSIDGRVRQRMTSNAGDIREPTWGPFAK